MKRFAALLLAALLCICLPGCQNSGSDDAWEDAVGNPTPQPTEPPESSEVSQADDGELHGKLVISEDVYYDADTLTLLANQFMALHKDVEITFEYEMDNNELVALSDQQDAIDQRRSNYLSQLKTKLMSGEAADIVFRVSGLNLYTVSQIGVFQDMSEYWNRDMAPEDYFMPILEAVQIDGKQSIIPFGFGAFVMYVNRRVTDGLGIDLSERNSITVTEMIEWYNLAREQGLMEQDAPMLFGQDPDYRTTLYSFERSAYLDVAQREAHFDSPEHIAFLSDLQALPEVDDATYFNFAQYAPLTDELIRTRLTGEETKVQNYPDMGPDGNYLDYVQQGKEGLFSYQSLFDVTARDGANNPCEYLAGPFVVTDSSGQAVVLPMNEFAVSSSCQNPELAWEFIKFCISDRDSLDFGGGNRYIYNNYLSINKANCRLQLESVKEFWGPQPGYANLSWYWNPDTDPMEIQAALDRFLDRPVLNYKMYNVPNATDYLDELLTQHLIDAEQCAAKIQDQAYVWLNE